MKVCCLLIMGLLAVTILVSGACSSDRPYYSSDEVLSIIKQRLQIVDIGSLEQDRYGAGLVGEPIVANFRLSDWEAEYIGQGRWRVAAEAKYYVGIYKETAECSWHFDEDSEGIKYIGNRQ